jgi:spore coat polysaccharide biosynthesis protein SpsF
MAEAAIALSRDTGAAYAGFSLMPVGSGVEVINVASLETAWREAADPYEREHVAPFLYRRPERFRIEVPEAPVQFRAPGVRITLDTAKDYEELQMLFDTLYRGAPLDLDQVVPYLMQREGSKPAASAGTPVRAHHAG